MSTTAQIVRNSSNENTAHHLLTTYPNMCKNTHQNHCWFAWARRTLASVTICVNFPAKRHPPINTLNCEHALTQPTHAFLKSDGLNAH